jgi:hypothetical protein
MTILAWSLGYQLDRFKRSTISLMAFKDYVRSSIVMVIDFIARLRNMRRRRN